MTIKERIEILNVSYEDNDQRIKEIKNEIEILNNQIAEWTEELDRCNDLSRQYEIERKALTILMDIYKDMYPDCDLIIDVVLNRTSRKRINVHDENFKLAQTK